MITQEEYNEFQQILDNKHKTEQKELSAMKSKIDCKDKICTYFSHEDYDFCVTNLFISFKKKTDEAAVFQKLMRSIKIEKKNSSYVALQPNLSSSKISENNIKQLEQLRPIVVKPLEKEVLLARKFFLGEKYFPDHDNPPAHFEKMINQGKFELKKPVKELEDINDTIQREYEKVFSKSVHYLNFKDLGHIKFKTTEDSKAFKALMKYLRSHDFHL